MNKLIKSLLLAAIASANCFAADYCCKREDIRIRDPFILTVNNKYYMYESKPWDGGRGVSVRTSVDLENWTEKKEVMSVPEKFRNDCKAVWAPEVHRYNNKYYLFTTLTFPQRKDNPIVAMGENVHQRDLTVRGTWVFVANSPEGPFKALGDGPVTPPDWMCLDGTLYVENGKPWIIFCHEWCQVGNGRMMIAPLSKDLSKIIGEPQEIFRAKSFPGAGNVTDGPFIFESKVSGKLEMIYSNFISGSGYAILKYESSTGKLAGPWIFKGPIYTKNGGHAMIFKKLNGEFALTFHQPNSPSPMERMHYFSVVDTTEGLKFADNADK